MQMWLVIGAWAFAVVFAIVLLGFAGYELAWKARRLAADRAKLDTTAAGLAELAAQLQAAADRAAAVRSSAASARPVIEPRPDPPDPA